MNYMYAILAASFVGKEMRKYCWTGMSQTKEPEDMQGLEMCWTAKIEKYLRTMKMNQMFYNNC